MNDLFKNRLIYTVMNDGSIYKYDGGIKEEVDALPTIDTYSRYQGQSVVILNQEQFDYRHDPNASALGLKAKELTDDEVEFYISIGFINEEYLTKDRNTAINIA